MCKMHVACASRGFNQQLYPLIRINILASFSSTAKTSPSKWARAGVSVTIGETKNVAQYLMKMKNYREMRGSSARNFYTQMGNVTTWLSAALTDQETFLDGFENARGKQAKMLRNQVLRSSYFTGNALALVNKLATSGLDLNDPQGVLN
ncbi:hypothetical protein REPUB_Repub12eG0135200 [Reevesia pubescens]